VLFLGARLDCARCHAHPTENWGQDDGLGMAAFFSKVAVKATQEWKEEVVFFNQHGGVWHPKLRDYVNPKFWAGKSWSCRAIRTCVEVCRVAHAPQNPYLPRPWRIGWYWLLGHGIVHEPDDFTHEPAQQPEL
jgi:hypothetical protein